MVNYLANCKLTNEWQFAAATKRDEAAVKAAHFRKVVKHPQMAATERNAREVREERDAEQQKAAAANAAQEAAEEVAKARADAAAKAQADAAAVAQAEALRNQPRLVIPLHAVALEIPVPPPEGAEANADLRQQLGEAQTALRAKEAEYNALAQERGRLVKKLADQEESHKEALKAVKDSEAVLQDEYESEAVSWAEAKQTLKYFPGYSVAASQVIEAHRDA
nr:tol-Pal system protein TolA-like [Aegilops tauschii subsp. strangulata]